MYKIEIKIRFSLQLDMDNVSQRRGRFRHGLNTKKSSLRCFFHTNYILLRSISTRNQTLV